jgi:hypothetical protein
MASFLYANRESTSLGAARPAVNALSIVGRQENASAFNPLLSRPNSQAVILYSLCLDG